MINEILVDKVRKGEAAIEHTQLEEDLPLLCDVIAYIFKGHRIIPFGIDRYYFKMAEFNDWDSSNKVLPSGMEAIPLNKFFVEEKEEPGWQLIGLGSSSSEAVDGWQKEKPVFTEDCLLLTADFYKDEYEYHSWFIRKFDNNMGEGWYWAWCCLDGEEYGDIADLSADLYKVINQPTKQ